MITIVVFETASQYCALKASISLPHIRIDWLGLYTICTAACSATPHRCCAKKRLCFGTETHKSGRADPRVDSPLKDG